MLTGYDSEIRPNQSGLPVEVAVSIFVSSFANIEETSMEYSVFMYFRQHWKDERLTGKVNKTVTLKGSAIKRVWTPDPFCHNGRQSNLGDLDEEIRSLLFLDPDGQITYSRLASVTAECLMDLQTFPADKQNCSLIFGSYSYSTADVVYKWKEGDAVTVGIKTLPQFQLTTVTTDDEIMSFTIGNYSTISVEFTFQRRLGYFLIQIYAPDIFIVMLSWIVFWMDSRDIGNRMALGITTILTIMFLMGSINESMPKVSYPKALDWYLIVSFVFIFCSLVECMIVFKLSDTPLGKDMPAGSELEYADKQNENKFVGYWIDFVSRILFPLLFITYNVYYWLIYIVL
ncbi:gamma-aminobutyric acid receptor subunit alpha-5 isoform X2 [Exaiptasia diaphana]|nr:gamma-aminobutyric acid receptor subunit alpha-5 isoform X2 [Exaiptasia diaphana]